MQGVLEAGCDEAGRGCLAGSVFAASVILPADFTHEKLTDSKKLSDKQRLIIRDDIVKYAVAWSVASVDHVEIDRINILNASIKAMHLALDGLSVIPEFIIVDGNRFKPYKSLSHRCIVKGDSLYYSIAAASILAKTFRDEYIVERAKEFPYYKWEKNKSYATLDHRQAIIEFGPCLLHRKTFLKKIQNQQTKLF